MSVFSFRMDESLLHPTVSQYHRQYRTPESVIRSVAPPEVFTNCQQCDNLLSALLVQKKTSTQTSESSLKTYDAPCYMEYNLFALKFAAKYWNIMYIL